VSCLCQISSRVEIYERAHCGGIGSLFPESVELSPATRDDHEGDTVGEHDFVAMLSPRWSLLAS